MIDELFEQYRRDGNLKAYRRFVEEQRALVYSVCRRYLHDPADVEDVVQETFLKLSHHSSNVSGSMTAWLTQTARSTCIDFIRKAIRERRRRRITAPADPKWYAHRQARRALVERHVQAGLLELDEQARDLIVARFYRKEPLRMIAGRYGIGVSGISRRVNTAVADLAAVLRDRGLESADELAIAEHLDEQIGSTNADDPTGDELR